MPFTPGPIPDENESHVGNAVELWGYNGTHVGVWRHDMVLTREGGGPFNLESFDFSGSPTDFEVPFTVTAQPGNVVADITADGRGYWVAVWASDDDPDGVIGSDFDILVARFTWPDCNDNLRLDDEDIAAGFSADENGNGIPDECDDRDRSDAVQDQPDPDAAPPGICPSAAPAMIATTLAGAWITRQIGNRSRLRRAATPLSQHSPAHGLFAAAGRRHLDRQALNFEADRLGTEFSG